MLLADDDFTAEIEFQSTERQAGVTLKSQGTGLISGPDSTLVNEHDFSNLSSTFIGADGVLIGAEGLTSITNESTLVDGKLYQSENGGRWRVTGGSDTTLGHVFNRLGAVGEFADVGIVTLDDVELHHLQPATDPAFEASYWDLDPSVLEDFVVLADVYTDDAGIPQQVHVQVGFRDPNIGAVIWEQVYRLSHINEPITVSPPKKAWIPLSTLGYDALADMLVPSDWAVALQEGSAVILGSPDGHLLGVGMTLYTSIDPEGALRDVLQSLQLEADSIQETDLGIFPSIYASIVDQPLTAAYAEVRPLGIDLDGSIVPYAALGLVLSTVPGGDVQNQLEDLISTITWRNPITLGGSLSLVPGETLADEVVQSDTINLILPRLADDMGCESLFIAHTDLVGGSTSGWTEDWYVAACGELLVLRVDYSLIPGGGFTISVGHPTVIGEQ